MTPLYAQSYLDDAARSGLDSMSIDNLRCGRITRQCMGYVRRKVERLYPEHYHDHDMNMADELNFLLEAGRIVGDRK